MTADPLAVPPSEPDGMSADGFTERLAAARTYVAAVRSRGELLPIHILDQIMVATDEAHALSVELGAHLRAAEPGVAWVSRVRTPGLEDRPLLNEVDARILIALEDLTDVCPHLEHVGPQPAWARLTHHRMDCIHCAWTSLTPPPGEDDRCDWCGRLGVTSGTPVALQRGPLVVTGGACSDCAEALGVEVPAQ